MKFILRLYNDVKSVLKNSNVHDRKGCKLKKMNN